MVSLVDRLCLALRLWREAKGCGMVFGSSEFLWRFVIFFGEWFERCCLPNSICWSEMWWLMGCVSSVGSPTRIVFMHCGYVTRWRRLGGLVRVFLSCFLSIFPVLPMLSCFCARRLLLGWWNNLSWWRGLFESVRIG